MAAPKSKVGSLAKFAFIGSKHRTSDLYLPKLHIQKSDRETLLLSLNPRVGSAVFCGNK